MNEKPAISVVLPTHNGASYIDQSIQSVICQTFQDWELIVVDDASTDDTPAKIQRWQRADARIRGVFLARNRRLPGALNEGFRRARGHWFTWTSDDNWYAPHALARLRTALLSRPATDIVYADCYLADQEGIIRGTRAVAPIHELGQYNCIGACFLYASEVDRQLGGYDERFFTAEDYDFWLRASNRFEFLSLAEPLYYYREHAASLTATKQYEVMTACFQAVLRWLPDAGWLDDSALARAAASWAARAVRVGMSTSELEDILVPGAEGIPETLMSAIHGKLPSEMVRTAWYAYWDRDWSGFNNCREYVRHLPMATNDPNAVALLKKRIYPSCVYRLKDRIDQLRPRGKASERLDER